MAGEPAVSSLGTRIDAASVAATITSRIDAAKEFLVVVLGFGLAASILEKLKHKQEIEIFDIFMLLIFILYGARFFFNNWLYLTIFYDQANLEKLSEKNLIEALYKSQIDLALNIFTGLIICFVSMTIYADRIPYLLICLTIHYLVDIAMLMYSVIQFEGYLKDDKKMVWQWLCNNALFAIIFLVVLYPVCTKNDPWISYAIAALWLLNSMLALLITYSHRTHPET
jgi:hypothetical protein